MDNRINKIRKQVKALRLSMLQAEAIMRDQINRDLECSAVAGEIIVMRTVMAHLIAERAALGDCEPILVDFAFTPRRDYAARPAKVVKRHLAPAGVRG